MERIRDILENSEDDRAVARALSILVQMESQNQTDEHKIVDVSIARRHAELDAIAADLGVEIGIVEDASRKAADSTIGAKGVGEQGVGDREG
jgi:hypothetical protein